MALDEAHVATPSPEQAEAAKRTFAGDLLTAVKAREAEFTKGWWKEANSALEIYSMDKDSAEGDTPSRGAREVGPCASHRGRASSRQNLCVGRRRRLGIIASRDARPRDESAHRQQR